MIVARAHLNFATAYVKALREIRNPPQTYIRDLDVNRRLIPVECFCSYELIRPVCRLCDLETRIATTIKD